MILKLTTLNLRFLKFLIIRKPLYQNHQKLTIWHSQQLPSQYNTDATWYPARM